MTLDDYVANPMGKSNAVMSAVARESQKSSYRERFNILLVRENGEIQYQLYNGKGDIYWIHLKIPSETVPDFYYDVVMKFTGNTELATTGIGLNKYPVQFFSNDPAFVYTYAYVFKRAGLLIEELEPRMAKKALRKAAVEKNPSNQVGYVKTIYFAYLFMKDRGLFNRTRYLGEPNFTKKAILEEVENADKKIQERQELGEKIKKKRKVSRSDQRERNATRLLPGSVAASTAIRNTKTVGAVKSTASTTKKTKSTRKF